MNELEIMELMNDIEYGWVDKDKNIYLDTSEGFSSNYALQSPEEILKTKTGVCWDQVELERYYFSQTNIPFKTYFMCYYDNDRCPTHTFLIYEKNNNYYWFEHSWKKYIGIHESNDLKELLEDIRSKFIEMEVKDKFNKNNMMLYEYIKPSYGLSVEEFYKHCEAGLNINIDNL